MGEALQHFATCGRIADAAAKIGVSRQSITAMISQDHDFAQAWGLAYDEYRDHVEQCIEARALGGVHEPIIGGKNRDEVVASVQRYETQLTIAFARRHIPEYGEKHQSIGTQVNTGVMVVSRHVADGKDGTAKQTEETWLNNFNAGGQYEPGSLPLVEPPPLSEPNAREQLEIERGETAEEKIARLEAELEKEQNNAYRRATRASRSKEAVAERAAEREAKKKAKKKHGPKAR
jgi:hypothetical protein